jgi:hypothetical protein
VTDLTLPAGAQHPHRCLQDKTPFIDLLYAAAQAYLLHLAGAAFVVEDTQVTAFFDVSQHQVRRGGGRRRRGGAPARQAGEKPVTQGRSSSCP